MKRFLIALLLVTLVSGIGYAQTVTDEKLVEKVEKLAVGKVELVTTVDAAKDLKAEIAIVEKDGKKMTFVIMPTTIVLDAEGKAITHDKIQVGEEVSVKYIAQMQGNEAVSVNIMKKGPQS
jgi:hypothetical protein